MSESKMREALEATGLIWCAGDECFVGFTEGNNCTDAIRQAAEALAQQPAAVVELTDAHPMQPVVMVGNVARFKANPIVEHLLDNGGIDMNALACMNFSREDREQFAQLIGYSVSGFGSLSYASDEVYDKASHAAEAHVAKQGGAA